METDDNSTIDEPHLVRLLVLEAGRVMEEASPLLAMRLPDEQQARGEFLSRIVQQAAAILLMAKAAATIDELN